MTHDSGSVIDRYPPPEAAKRPILILVIRVLLVNLVRSRVGQVQLRYRLVQDRCFQSSTWYFISDGLMEACSKHATRNSHSLAKCT